MINIEDLVASAIEGGKTFKKEEPQEDATKIASELEALANTDFEEEAANLKVYESEKTAKLQKADELFEALAAVCSEESES